MSISGVRLRTASGEFAPGTGRWPQSRRGTSRCGSSRRPARRCRRESAGVHERARREYAVAVETGQARAVRVDRPQALNRACRPVDVFPASVNDPPVVQDRRRKVHQVVRGQPPLVPAVAVHPVQDRRGDDVAVGIGRLAVGDKGDPAVRQPARVEVVVGAVRQLFESRPVDGDAKQVVVARFVGIPRDVLDVGHGIGRHMPAAAHGKDDLAAVVRQVGGGDHPFAGVEDALQLAAVFLRRKHVQPAAGPVAFDVVDIDVRDVQRFAFDQQDVAEAEPSVQQVLARARAAASFRSAGSATRPAARR